MNAIIKQSRIEADELLIKIDDNTRHLFNIGTTNYTYYIEHPSNGTFAVIIDLNDLSKLDESIISNIGEDVNNIIEIVYSEWVIKETPPPGIE